MGMSTATITTDFHEHFHQFKSLEADFNASALSPQHITLLESSGLTPSDCLLYGEFLFLLTGLKQCILIKFIDEDLTDEYVRCVCLPVVTSFPRSQPGAGHGEESERVVLRCERIQHALASPEESWKGAHVMFLERIKNEKVDDRENNGGSSKIEQTSRDFEVSDTQTSTDYTLGFGIQSQVRWALLNPSRTFVSETTLQRLLDYPGSLPTTEEQLATTLEIAYLDRTPHSTWTEATSTLVTSFVAQRSELASVRQHFSKYKDKTENLMNLQLCIVEG